MQETNKFKMLENQRQNLQRTIGNDDGLGIVILVLLMKQENSRVYASLNFKAPKTGRRSLVFGH